MAGIYALEADLLGQGDHGRARGLIVRASKHSGRFAHGTSPSARLCQVSQRGHREPATKDGKTLSIHGRTTLVGEWRLPSDCARTGNPEVISSSVGLVPTNRPSRYFWTE